MNYSFRKLMNDLHLWLGIASGLILFIVCLTGTIYTFRTEIEEWLEPHKFEVEVLENKPLAIETLITKVEAQTQGKVVGFTIPTRLDQSYSFTVKKSLKERRGKKYYVNAYNGTVLGNSDSSSKPFFMIIFKLHRWLLLDMEIGRIIVGSATLIFVFLCFSGLILWFPRKWKRRNFKQGLKIKTNANWKRINYDLHNTLGFYALIIMLIMALTGLCWSFDWYRTGLGNMIGTEIWGRSKEKIISDTLQISSKMNYDALQNTIENEVNYKGILKVYLPNKKEDVISIRTYNPEKWSPSTPDKLIVDQYSGKILKTTIFSELPLNERIANLIYPLHTGEIYGIYSKIIYCIVCLIATTLPVTGTIIWINKLKKKKK
ncbi:assimilatory sulfite reductase (NADPH) [Flavobacteriaceae bacterium UJ101]|nr:assimilatory sulfite reductase (NADPH) [Flavobacteriaceae bacterium UJ101]